MKIKIISYRFYNNFDKFEKKYRFLINLILNKNINITEYRYAHHKLIDINNIEKSTNDVYADFSAYKKGLAAINKNKSSDLVLLLNDSFFIKWPLKIIAKRMASMIDENITSYKFPIGVGQAEHANNFYSNKFNEFTIATHFILLNNISANFLLTTINSYDRNKIKNPRFLLQKNISLKSNTFLKNANVSNKYFFKKEAAIYFEYSLSKYIFNKGIAISVFDSFLIKILFYIKKILLK